ncbi:hypothetical protein HU200_049723 [Digitaria exilis]|uniref:Uncharacterized protein n=1 Tax=Digitaria exilis TaxID=1010633 RepID=A0A835EAX4_9POAL|nr:hypothetical protein HU200_049723 [Digitaria exilis]
MDSILSLPDGSNYIEEDEICGFPLPRPALSRCPVALTDPHIEMDLDDKRREEGRDVGTKLVSQAMMRSIAVPVHRHLLAPASNWFIEPGHPRVVIRCVTLLCPSRLHKERSDTMMTRRVTVDGREAEETRRRNAELEKAVAEAAAREERLRRELEAALARLAVAEEAEERLCVQLGELEAEAVTQAMEYQEHVRALSERLSFADGVLRRSSGASTSSAAVAGVSIRN